MTSPAGLLEQNRRWAARVRQQQPDLFEELSEGQTPEYLWIGCSDSRVPPSQVVGCDPGDLFVHRNIANRIDPGDLNGLSVLQYAVEVLRVPHVVVCGHYRCGGVQAAMQHEDYGLIDNWLRPLKHLYARHAEELDALDDEVERWDRLCELNVIDQVRAVACSTIAQQAWRRGQDLTIHGWIYGLADGKIQDLEVSISSPDQVPAIYRGVSSEQFAE